MARLRGAARPPGADLAAAIHTAWHDPARLRAVVTDALHGGRAAEVVMAAQRLADIDHSHADATDLLAAVLWGAGDPAGAERMLQDYVKTRGGTAPIWFTLATLAAARGDARDVAAALDRSLRHDPDHARALEWGAGYHRHHGGQEASVRWLWAHAEGSWRAHQMLGALAMRSGDPDRALAYFDGAVALAPREPGAGSGALGELYRAGEYRRLVEFAERHPPSDPLSLILLAETNLRLGRPDDAMFTCVRLRGTDIPAELSERADDLDARVRAASGM